MDCFVASLLAMTATVPPCTKLSYLALNGMRGIQFAAAFRFHHRRLSPAGACFARRQFAGKGRWPSSVIYLHPQSPDHSARAGVIGLSRSVAVEWAPLNIVTRRRKIPATSRLRPKQQNVF
jgi:NAD(P)-dependent dehydrogenase (short-subunit alcohol dehydrogenase family)